MNSPDPVSPAPDAAAKVPVGPGHLLRKAREKAGLTLDLAAGQLNVSGAILRDLENDDYTRIAVETFAAGYIRSYARILKLDPEPLMALYRTRSDFLRPAAELKPAPRRNTGAPWVARLVVLLLWLIGLVTVGWLIYALLRPVPETAVVSAAPAVPVVAPAVPVAAPVGTAPAADTAVPGSAVSPGAAFGAVEPEVLLPATDTEPAPLDQLHFVFSDECWLEVTDGKGDVLSADLYQKGQEAALSGRAPFNVMVGNVNAVTATFNGEPLRLETDGIRRSLRTVVGQ